MKKTIIFILLVLLTALNSAHGQTGSMPGNTMENPRDLGTYFNTFRCSETHDTNMFTDNYRGQSTKDVFHRFTLTVPMNIVISHCSSPLTDTYLHVLNASGNRIYYNDDYSGPGACSVRTKAYLKIDNMPAGTYYIVSEGKSANGFINTVIEGTSLKPPFEYAKEMAINVGSKSSSFVYSDTKNTNSFKNLYGRTTKEVLYELKLETDMDLIISHCGSEVADTYVYLVNQTGYICYASNDDYSGPGACGTTTQAYLKYDNLRADRYYIISEGKNTNGNITTRIEGRTNPPGNNQSKALNLGTKTTGFVYTDTQDTNRFTDDYQGQPTNDVFYTFTLDTPMDITVSHCGSGVADTYVHFLDASGNRIGYNDNYSGTGACSNTAQAYLKMENLPVGTYYVVSEGKSANGSITTRIEGALPPNPPGNKMSNAIEIGARSTDFVYTNTRNTNEFTNEYGLSTKEVFYKLVLTAPMEVTITHCGSEVLDTYLHVLDANGNRLYYNDDNDGTVPCENSTKAYLWIGSLPAGTYYIVSEGKNTNGNITTRVKGGVALPHKQGNRMSNPLIVDTNATFFHYYDTRDTKEFGNEYQGQPTNDVFYKLVLTNPMSITISHCGSIVTDTYLHVLDASGNRIYYNDDYTGQNACAPGGTQSYLYIESLPIGTYYIVSEGKNANGLIGTRIEGIANPQGNKRSNPLDVGSKSSFFVYSDTKNTELFTNEHAQNPTRDVFYKFTLNRSMDVIISHCGSGVADTYLTLLNGNGQPIGYNDNHTGEGACSNTAQAYLRMNDLAAGTYYVVSEGKSTNGNITTRIEGRLNPQGNKLSKPMNVGTMTPRRIYTNTQDTNGFTNEYNGQSTNDAFYKFTLDEPLDIIISHCGSAVTDTYVHLLDASGNRIAYNDNHTGEGACSNTAQAYLRMNDLAAGTYYVVSEGKSANGSIITQIEGRPNPQGNKMSKPMNVGAITPRRIYTDIKDTNGFTNEYSGQSTYDVFYKFTLGEPLDIIISHCGSAVADTYVHLLDASGNRIAYNDNHTGEGACSNTAQAYLRMNDLAAGTYYVVSEGKTANGSISTRIEGRPNPQGNKISKPIDLQTIATGFTYTNTQNTDGFTDEYRGQSTNDVFYKFKTNEPLDVTISHCGSAVADTYVHLLDASGNRIDYNDNYSGEGACGNTTQAYLKLSELSPGTYYIVSEGKTANGGITTNINAITPLPNPLGNKMSKPIDLGEKSTSFVYSDTQNTNGFTDEYRGQSTNDVFYKFTLATSMNITISHCGSEINDTYLHLLDASGNRIDYNDNYYVGDVCGNTAQAYLRKDNLAAGTYYVVSEGKNENGVIFTRIEGDKYEAPEVNLSQNYILTITPTVSVSSTDGITTNRALKTIQYFDGLGRPVQTVQLNATPDKSDLVTYQEYDGYGRESKSWLPVVAANNNGAFVPYANFVSKALVSYNNDAKAYSEPVYESSPLSRVLEQYGPGQDWHNNGKAIRTAYLLNNSTRSCKLYTTSNHKQTISITRASSTTNYTDAQLYVTRLTDEDGNISYEFKDKLGQVVLTRQMEGANEHDTYYIYDSYGNLRAVLPPLAADNLNAGTWDESNTYLQQYAYLYKYDSRNRCIAKKLPGAEWIYNVYDKADHLIFTQDGEQRTRDEWTFNISDALGRSVLNGTCNNTLTYTAQLDSVVVGKWVGSENIYKGYKVNGVQLTTPKVLNVNYYDSYAFMDKNGIPSQNSDHYRYDGGSGFSDRYWDSEKGLHTGSLSALLDGANEPNYMISVMYYDKQGRMAQNHTQSHITDGIDKHYIRYSITGEPVRSEHLHAGTGRAPVTEYIDYEYDHARRLLSSNHQLRYVGTLGDKVTLASNSYDALGRLSSKVLHGNVANPINYTYNIRGWLTGIGNTHFTENLYYNTGNSEPLYNGNISSMTWKVRSESNMRGYKFDYDGLSRLTQATYGEGNLIANNANHFTEKVTGYDKHGNITGLQRHGKTSSTGYGLIDNLTFGYTGNRMQYVNDAVTTSLADGTFHFVNGSNSTGNEYMYDANGNLIKDSNKNIVGITYNLLNLPTSVQLSDNRTATYLYDAAGMKRKVTHQGGGENKMTEYCSNVIYENSQFSKILTEEGYLTVANERPTYHYYLKDHLGNNRVVLNQDGTTVEQVSHYYPFGGVFDQTAEDVQRYKFGGKELDRTYGLDLYDYSARYMDGALGRFTTMDPMAEKYYSISPYVYCANNPMRFVDPTGMVYGDPPGFWESLGKGVVSPFVSFGHAVAHPIETVKKIAAAVEKATPLELAVGITDQVLRGPGSPFSGQLKQIDVAQAVAYDQVNGTTTSAEVVGSQIGETLFDGAATATGVVGAKAAGALGKGVSSIGKTKGLANPFKKMTLDQVRVAMDKHVDTGKLKVVHKDPVTGLNKVYYNNKSGYSYNLDKGGQTRVGRQQIIEPPHVDVNYPKPKPKHIEKKKIFF